MKYSFIHKNICTGASSYTHMYTCTKTFMHTHKAYHIAHYACMSMYINFIEYVYTLIVVNFPKSFGRFMDW